MKEVETNKSATGQGGTLLPHQAVKKKHRRGQKLPHPSHSSSHAVPAEAARNLQSAEVLPFEKDYIVPSGSETLSPLKPLDRETLDIQSKVSHRDDTISAAIKDRIRSKVLKAKTKAESRGRLETSKSAGFQYDTPEVVPDEGLSRDDFEAENAFQAHVKSRDQWRKAANLAVSKSVPFVVAYDFFTRVWDSDSPKRKQSATGELPSSSLAADVQESVAATSAGEIQELENDNYDEEALLFRKEYAALEDQWDMVCYRKAKYIPLKERMNNERNFLFVPSRQPASLLDKFGGQREPHFPEDDGLYVGKKPKVPKKNANIVENRFITQKETAWFDVDGTLQSVPDPFSSMNYHHRPEDSDELTFYRKALIVDNSRRYISDRSLTWYQLDVDVSAIVFHHHPLFSQEHVLSSQLTLLYKHYAEVIQSNAINHINIKLKALRAAVHNLTQSLDRHGDDADTDSSDRMKRLEFYQDQVRTVRQLRDSKMEEMKTMEQNILHLWQEIKALRQSQGYTSTTIKLKIHRESTDKEAEEQEFEDELLQELQEEQDAFSKKYDELMEIYSKQMVDWQKAAKKQSKKKQKAQSSEGPSSSRRLSESQASLLSSPLKEPSRPISPEPFNEEVVKENIRKKMLRCWKRPGDPKLLFELCQTAVTPNGQCPKSEQQRRTEVSKRRVSVKILFNNKEACKTSERALMQNFTVSFGQIFNLRIIHWPETLCLQVYEASGITNTMIAEVFVPLPEPGITLNDLKTSEYDFSSELFVPPKHGGIGAGVQFSANERLPSQWLLTGGVLKCRVGWGVEDNGEILSPLPSTGAGALSTALKNKIGTRGLSDVRKLKEWAEQSQLDPNDPENVAVFQALQRFTTTSDAVEKSGYFRLDPLYQEFKFVSEDDILKNNRFRLLMLRSQGVPEYRNYHMVPVLEKEIPAEIFQVKEKIESPIKAKEGLELQREKASKMLKKLWIAMMAQFQSIGTQRTLEDVVVEDQVPSIGSIGFNLLYLSHHRRPLYPIRKERKKVTGQNVTSADVKIIVQIRYAMNVPVRTDTDLLKTGRHSSLDFQQTQVRPFVEVMFQRETVQTEVAEGPQPTWNQELHLPFRAPDDNYTPSGLQKIQDKIYLNLFDEVTVDLLEDDRDRETTIHERLERHWLGNLKIPFSTLYLNSKIEGNFRLNVPPVLLGYDYEPKPWKLSRASEEEDRYTYLSVFLTIEPALQLPETIKEQCISEEPESLLWKADQWQKNLTAKFPNRQIKAFAVDLTGRWVFVTRYLRPLQPPEELVDQESTHVEEKLARFVSLIPARSDSVVYQGICDIWTTCDHFLQTLIGDEEEHAILLCNYFLFLKKKAFLLLGEAIPEGPTAYVLTVESNTEFLVWNATTGECFNIKDSHSPLQKVGCLINADNICANVQKNDHPSQMNFDLSKKHEWKPFFTGSFQNPGLRSVQPEQLTYTPTDLQYVQHLQGKIEGILKESIMKWRRRYRTLWNRFCMQALRKTLPKLEQNGIKTASMDSLQELEEILVSYKMTGFPLSMPYTDINAVVEAVFATGVHQVEKKNAEFALAVYLHPYPCNVLAVWVYVAILTRIR